MGHYKRAPVPKAFALRTQSSRSVGMLTIYKSYVGFCPGEGNHNFDSTAIFTSTMAHKFPEDEPDLRLCIAPAKGRSATSMARG